MTVIDSITWVVDKIEDNCQNQNEPLESVKYRFYYPLPINKRGTRLRVNEYLLEYVEDFTSFGYKLKTNSQRNDR